MNRTERTAMKGDLAGANRGSPGGRVVGWAAVVALVLTPAPALGQGDLEVAVEQVVAAWSTGDLSDLAELMTPRGIVLHLPDQSSPAVGVRQARAALEAFLARAGTGEARTTRVQDLGGDPRRGFAELEWSTGAEPPAGGSFTAFVGFSVADGAWRIVEIRVFPGTARP